MKKPAFAIILTLATLLTACTAPPSTEPSDTTLPSEVALPYSIIQEGGEYYLMFREKPYPHHFSNMTGMILKPEIVFSTFNELRFDIQTANFAKNEWHMLYKFLRASSDPYERKIPIFNHIYVPILPESAQITEIIWGGAYYTIDIHCNEAQKVSFDPFYSQAQYQEAVLSYQNFESSGTNEVTSTSFDPERSATVYHYTFGGAERRLAYYSFTSNGIEYHIAETYDSPEATTPIEIDIYANNNGRYFFITLSGLTLRPSVEWLTSFGVKEEPHLQATVTEPSINESQSYTSEEAKKLFPEHQQLFNDLVTVLMNDDDFLQEGRIPGRESEGAILNSPDSEYMELFSPEDQKIIRQFFQLKPVEIVYSLSGLIEISFAHTPDANSHFTQCHFVYWDDPAHLEEAIKDLQTVYHVDRLADDWILYY